MMINEKIDLILSQVRAELLRAEAKHGLVFASPHEGHSVIEEEFDELWEDVKADRGREKCASDEAIQIAAMAVKYVFNFDSSL
jgi:hypothetical protein